MNHMPEGCRPACAPRFTPKQGQYLAFIHAYTLVIGRPPAEADLQRFFQVTPPSVHQMVITLERNGLIRRRPGIGPKHRGAGRSRSATGPPRQSRSTRQFFCAEVLAETSQCGWHVGRNGPYRHRAPRPRHREEGAEPRTARAAAARLWVTESNALWGSMAARFPGRPSTCHDTEQRERRQTIPP